MARQKFADASALPPPPRKGRVRRHPRPSDGRGAGGEGSKTNPNTSQERGVPAVSTPVGKSRVKRAEVRAPRSSPLLDTRVVYCGDNLEQLRKLPPACVDLIYIDPPFNSNRNYEVFWGETKEKHAFEDRHAAAQAYIDYMRPRCEMDCPNGEINESAKRARRCA